MNTISKRYIWAFFSILMAVMVTAYVLNVVYSPQEKPRMATQENESSTCITVKDSDGHIIFQTGEPVTTDDEFISADNTHYIVTRVNGSQGLAMIKPDATNTSSGGQVSERIYRISDFFAFKKNVPAAAPLEKTHVVIYHTHTDESYIPTSGTASKPGEGDIYEIGKALQDALELEGVSVTHSDNAHDPHDINAYHRSRRTAAALIKEQPDAIFDIHRDSAPPESYSTSINGIQSARVMIVVGRSNPNMKTNLDYAKAIKEASDLVHPGLMRGIFMGKGDYNQDLYPTAVLFEVGTDKLSQDDAELATHHLSDAITRVLADK